METVHFVIDQDQMAIFVFYAASIVMLLVAQVVSKWGDPR